MNITNTKNASWDSGLNSFNKNGSSNTTKQQDKYTTVETKPDDVAKDTSFNYSTSKNSMYQNNATRSSSQQSTPIDGHVNELANELANDDSNSTTSATKSSNLMSNNFASNDNRPSRYIASLIDGFQEMRQFENESAKRTLAIMETAKKMYQSAKTLGEQHKVLAWIEENLTLHAEKEVMDEAERTYLKKMREQIIEELEKLLKEAEEIEKLYEESQKIKPEADKIVEGESSTDSNDTNTEAEITVSDGNNASDMNISVDTGTTSSDTSDVSITKPATPIQVSPAQDLPPAPESAPIVSTQSSNIPKFSLNIVV